MPDFQFPHGSMPIELQNQLSSEAAQADEAAPELVQVGIFYVGKHGNDQFNGRSLGQAFLTFGAALSAANAGDVVVCLDGGTYTERVTVPAGVVVYAPNANLVGSGQGAITRGALEINDGYCVFNKVTAAGSESAVVKPDSAGTARFHANEVILPGTSQIGILNISTSAGGVLLAKVDSITVGASCIGVGSITQAIGHTHIEAEDIYLAGASAVGLASAFLNGSMVARIGHILETGAHATTLGINVQNGTIQAFVMNITADTGWNVGALGTLALFYGSYAGGANTETGTVTKSTPV